MSRLDGLSISSTGTHGQLAAEVTSEMNKPNDWSSEESINTTARIEEQVSLTALSNEEPEMTNLKVQPADPTGGVTHAPPMHEATEQTDDDDDDDDEEEEEDDEDEEIMAPVGLIMKLLTAVMDRDFQFARRLCHMILIYEPDNAEASEFLEMINKKLQQDREAEQSTEEDEEEDEDEDEDEVYHDAGDGDGDFKRDEGSSQSSSSSSSSSGEEEEEEEEEHVSRQVSRHKLCPPHSFP